MREQQNGHRAVNLWFTGLSGAGKSTLAQAVEEVLHRHGCRSYVLDGDNVRHGLCGDLGFSPEDRTENLRRIGEMVRLFLDAGIITLTAFISPMARDRDHIRRLLGADFLEIYCRCPLKICEQRDVKGLYRKARAGIIRNYTGISAPYEVPSSPDLILDTARQSLDACVAQILHLLRQRGVLTPATQQPDVP